MRRAQSLAPTPATTAYTQTHREPCCHCLLVGCNDCTIQQLHQVFVVELEAQPDLVEDGMCSLLVQQQQLQRRWLVGVGACSQSAVKGTHALLKAWPGWCPRATGVQSRGHKLLLMLLIMQS